MAAGRTPRIARAHASETITSARVAACRGARRRTGRRHAPLHVGPASPVRRRFCVVPRAGGIGRAYRGLHLFALDRISYITQNGLSGYLTDAPFDALNTGAALLALGLIVPVTRRLGVAYGALVAVLALPPLLIGGAMSMGRMTSVLFPMFIWLAAELPVKYRTGLLVAFATLQGFAATLNLTWRPLF